MESIKEIFKIGHGPSSSHTMGPVFAAERFLGMCPSCEFFKVELYGTLALTGKGHFTDIALIDFFTSNNKKVEIVWKPDEFLPLHPNGMRFFGYDSDFKEVVSWTVYSVGGGAIKDEKDFNNPPKSIYPLTKMDDILEWCEVKGATLWEYVENYEGKEIWDYLEKVWDTMVDSIKRGLKHEGVLPGELHLQRKAASYHMKAKNSGLFLKSFGLVASYALAVSEENAAAGTVVTAPTCGSSGVLPGVLYFLKKFHKLDKERILRALATAGLIGNLVKENASISGAEVGCQGEVGTACAMASAAATQLLGGTVAQIEYAAEMGMEHHLGLTCDPVGGYVQIPCIERNAFAAGRALQCATYSLFSDGKHRISFDEVVITMKETGLSLPTCYKETGTCGLAKHWLDSEKRKGKE